MLTCQPGCEVSTLSVTDWAWLMAFGITVYALSRLWGKWAFSRQRYPAYDLRWHIPRLIYVAFVTAALTLLPIYTFAGGTLGDWYALLFYLPTVILAYSAWLIVDINDPRKHR